MKTAKQWEFYHTTSSPYHHQSNGKAESAVKIAKRLLKKATQDKKDINLTILEWRNTPTEGGPYSPVQKLQSRRTHTLLPTSKQLLDPDFAKQWEFYHTTSSPYHHQSNAKAESAVKIAIRLLKKATQVKKTSI